MTLQLFQQAATGRIHRNHTGIRLAINPVAHRTQPTWLARELTQVILAWRIGKECFFAIDTKPAHPYHLLRNTLATGQYHRRLEPLDLSGSRHVFQQVQPELFDTLSSRQATAVGKTLQPGNALRLLDVDQGTLPLPGNIPCTLTQYGKQLADRKSTRLNSSHVRISYAV